MNVGDLRPEGGFQTDDGDSILTVWGETPETIRRSRTAKARGYNEVFKGNLVVSIAEPVLLAELLREALGLR